MPVLLDKNSILFPPVSEADGYGLLAMGGDLSTERLLTAYRQGIFPWFIEDGNIMWYSPDPRWILIPQNLIISKSMQSLLKRKAFEFTINKDFEAVIRNCRERKREGSPGSWIDNEFMEAYIDLHRKGYAMSAEVWQDGELAGGLYGIKIGKVFFGESMFTNVSNASKFAFIRFVQHLQKGNVALIYCQVYTPHLYSLGAASISREDYVEVLKMLL